MKVTAELLPCPFCGSAAALENLARPEHERHITAGCSNENCFAYLPSVYFAREADAIAAWNRRVSASPSIGRVGGGDEAQIIAELQQAVSNWQRRAYAAEDELKRLTSASSDPLSVDRGTLRPLADREKSATLVYHEEPAGDTQGAAHPDDNAVDRFAAAMKAKLAQKRAEGRGGWEDKDDCSNEFLSDLLRGHVLKGDPVDVANFAMMIHQRGERIAALVSPPDNGEAGNG